MNRKWLVGPIKNSFKKFSALEDSQQLLVALALCSYFSLGLFLGLFANGFDFEGLHLAASRVLSGQGAMIYHEFFSVDAVQHAPAFGYAPPVVLFYTPLGGLPLSWAWPLFLLICHLCLMGAWRLAILEARDRGIAHPVVRVTVMMGLFFPLYYSLWVGQCEAILLFLLLAAMRLNRRGDAVLAGLLIAIAATFKIFLGLVFVYFLLKRQWRLLAGSVAGLVILYAASLTIVPFEIQHRYWLFAPTWTGKLLAFYDNQAISGVFARLLTTNYYTHGILHLPMLAQALQWSATSVIAIVYVLRLKYFETAGFGAGFGYTLVTALLLSPLTDTHHFTFLLIPFLLYTGAPQSGLLWRWFYAFFAVTIPIVAFKFSDVPHSAFFAAGIPTLIFSIPFFVLMALWIYWPAPLRRAELLRPKR